ncbi:MAG TPA: twin-arginine translocation signal domain-containing protein [Burkholderiaceae bacterium]|nr:twin-arginine translocation signal domain-containing protein [Burkholderiaceae bacterium]
MANHRNRFPARRRFLKQSTALTATVVALPLPRLARARSEAGPAREDAGRSTPLPAGVDATRAPRRRRERKQ